MKEKKDIILKSDRENEKIQSYNRIKKELDFTLEITCTEMKKSFS